jgi:hypothetical protein
MSNTVTVWIRMAQNTSLAQSLTVATTAATTPLIMRLNPSRSGETAEDFVFPYNPISVQYGQLSDEIAQIPRPGTTPIVAFKSHRLMTVDMTFTLAKPGDGLVASVDKDLAALRRFATSSQRLVSLINFDISTKKPMLYRNMSREANVDGLFFSIVDFSFDSTRRNKNNEVTQANCRLSLIENRNPFQDITYIPILKIPKPLKDCKDPEYKKKYPERCPDDEKTITRKLPASEEIRLLNASGYTIQSKLGQQFLFEYLTQHPEYARKYGVSPKAYDGK